jgi:hypothetical protein
VNARNENSEVTNSIIITGGAAGANVQNVHGTEARAVNYQEQGGPDTGSVQELIENIRALLNEARPELDDADEYDAALEEIEAGVASPKQNRFSIRGALDVLGRAAVIVTGLSDAIAALKQAIGLP